MMVVLAAKKASIQSMALVHDSFGCLPNDAARFREIIKETFEDLYTSNEPLKQIKQENCAYLVTNGYKLPELPSSGDLDLTEYLVPNMPFA
jgi:DNA-directed RNA polymerase